ncbi:MAG: hypothetical protein E7249_15665 [Paenibacillaceae bacterium]|nr:hypothetical protein [Paenibacillaceae bacterium]
MRFRRAFIVILFSLSLASTGVAMAGTSVPNQYQSEGVLEYWKLMDSFSNKSIAKSNSINYPDYYGGAYIRDSGELVILTTESGDSQRSLNMINATIVPAEYSLNEL